MSLICGLYIQSEEEHNPFKSFSFINIFLKVFVLQAL